MLLTDILTTQENKTGGISIVLAPDFVQTGEAVRRSFFPDRMLGLGKVLDDFKLRVANAKDSYDSI